MLNGKIFNTIYVWELSNIFREYQILGLTGSSVCHLLSWELKFYHCHHVIISNSDPDRTRADIRK